VADRKPGSNKKNTAKPVFKAVFDSNHQLFFIKTNIEQKLFITVWYCYFTGVPTLELLWQQNLFTGLTTLQI